MKNKIIMCIMVFVAYLFDLDILRNYEDMKTFIEAIPTTESKNK
jgi:hypothetical protein